MIVEVPQRNQPAAPPKAFAAAWTASTIAT
jgi:hypothetical protein